MPQQRTIYVRDDDAPLYDRAAQLAGDDSSLSAVIASALRAWIARQESAADDYEDYTLQPGAWPIGGLKGAPRDDRPVKFRGRLLAEYCDGSRDDNRKTTWRIYQTVGRKLVVEADYDTRWQGEYCTRRVEIYDSLDAVISYDADEYHDPTGDLLEVPECVLAEAQSALGQDPAIYVE